MQRKADESVTRGDRQRDELGPEQPPPPLACLQKVTVENWTPFEGSSTFLVGETFASRHSQSALALTSGGFDGRTQ